MTTIYDKAVKSLEIAKEKDIQSTRKPLTDEDSLAHLSFMVESIENFEEEGKFDKANRWLGYIQGVLVSRGFATVNDFKEVNRK